MIQREKKYRFLLSYFVLVLALGANQFISVLGTGTIGINYYMSMLCRFLIVICIMYFLVENNDVLGNTTTASGNTTTVSEVGSSGDHTADEEAFYTAISSVVTITILVIISIMFEMVRVHIYFCGATISTYD